MTVAFNSLCFIIIIIIIGDTTNRLLFKNSFCESIFLRLSLAYGLGTGVFSLLLFYLLYLGLPLNNYTIFCIAVFFVILFVMNKKYFFSGLSFSKLFSLPSSKKQRIWNGFLSLILLTSLTLIFFKALFLPMHLGDDRAQWGAKAKTIYYEKTIYSESFKDPQRLQLHAAYPLLIPLLEASLFSFMKEPNDCMVRILFPLYFTGLLFFIYSSQKRYASHSHSLLFTAMLSVLPVFIKDVNGNPSAGFADVPLAFYYTVSVLSIFNWFKSKRLKELMLSILFASFVIFTKQEGLVLWLVVIFALGIKVLFGNKNDKTNKYRYLIICLVLPLVVLIPWFQFRSTLSVPPWEKDWSLSHFSAGYILSHLNRVLPILTNMADFCLSIKSWNILCIMFFGVILFCSKTSFRFPLFFIVSLIFVNTAAVIGATFFYPWVWWPTFLFDLSRLLIMNIPLIIFFISYAVSTDELFKKLKAPGRS